MELMTTSARSGPRMLGRALLRFSLFHKLLLGNALIGFAAAVAEGWIAVRAITAQPGTPPWTAILLVSAGALAASLALNAIVIRAALSPIGLLEDAARRVQAGDFSARAAIGLFADRDIEELAQVFNLMLDTLAEHRTTIREVAARRLDAAETERLRIASELHDNTAQSLAAILIQLKLARDTADPAQRNALIASISTTVTAAVEELRRIAQELRPPSLDMLGLRAALEAHSRTLSETSGLQIEVDIRSIDRVLSGPSELVLYRLVQDALSNVLQHATTRMAKLRVWAEAGRIVAEVSDQGRGFSMAEMRGKNMLGLLSMHERASYAGGSVKIEAEPGKGTLVRIELPITSEESHD